MLLSEHFHTHENLNFIYNPRCAYRFFSTEAMKPTEQC